MQTVIFCAIFLAGAVIGVALFWFTSARHLISRSKLEELRDQKVSAETTVASLANENHELKEQHKSLSQEVSALREQAVAIETEKKGLQERVAQYQTDLKEMQRQLSLHFENVANKIFQEKSSVFKQEAQTSLQDLLGPLRERLGEFQKRVEESFGSQAKEQFSLRKEIERIVGVNEKMTLQTESLTKALRGDNKVQGNWGEVILEKILEESGLRKDEDYYVQGAGLGMKHPEGGQSLKPDIVVRLPEEKHIIIDSKVSLLDYERYCGQEDEIAQAQHLRQFIDSLKRHVNGLEKRRYQDVEGLGSPDFVLMFLPIEGAYSLAVQKDQEIHSYAWNKKVAIVCPSTLFVTLRTIASVWRLEMQKQNHQEIARRGGKLYDKIAGFLEDMSKLGNSLTSAQNTFENAMNKLSEGRGNVLRQAEQLRELGAQNSKSISQDLLSEEETPVSIEEVKLLKNSN